MTEILKTDNSMSRPLFVTERTVVEDEIREDPLDNEIVREIDSMLKVQE
jgi:hypothetical protein